MVKRARVDGESEAKTRNKAGMSESDQRERKVGQQETNCVCVWGGVWGKF